MNFVSRGYSDFVTAAGGKARVRVGDAALRGGGKRMSRIRSKSTIRKRIKSRGEGGEGKGRPGRGGVESTPPACLRGAGGSTDVLIVGGLLGGEGLGGEVQAQHAAVHFFHVYEGAGDVVFVFGDFLDTGDAHPTGPLPRRAGVGVAG